MNLKVVGYVLALAKSKNFHQAAQECGVSQPALSTAVKSLEEYLGVEIFVRTTRKVNLTVAGKKIIAQLSVINGEFGALLDLANYHKETEGIPIRLAVEESITNFIMPLIKQIKSRLPEIDLHLFEENNKTALCKLMNSSIDLAILPSSNQEYPGLLSEIVVQEPLLLLAPIGHVLTKKQVVSINEILSEKFILPHNECLHFDAIRNAVGASFETMNANSFKTKTMQGICMMINAGMGIGFVPASFVDSIGAYNLQKIETESPIQRSLKLYWRANEERTHSFGHIKRIILGANSIQI